MARFIVWHRTQPTFMINTAAVLDSFPKGFSEVATVETDDVRRVFQLTNSIDYGWWENPEVTMCPAFVQGARSTSVGDVIVGADGHFSIESVGLKNFRPVTTYASIAETCWCGCGSLQPHQEAVEDDI